MKDTFTKPFILKASTKSVLYVMLKQPWSDEGRPSAFPFVGAEPTHRKLSVVRLLFQTQVQILFGDL